MQRMDPYDLGYVCGNLVQEGDDLVLIPHQGDHMYPNMFLSKDFRLSDFRQCLEDIGLKSVFRQGTLVVEDKVVIGKRDGKLFIEGMASREYFMVRRMLYMQHALV